MLPYGYKRISQKGIDLIKEFEGLELEPYKCPAGKLTIGYGHVIKARDAILKLTKEAAEELLKKDIKPIEDAINKNLKVKVTQGQFDALCSLAYNIGTTRLLNSKGFKYLNYDDEAEFFDQAIGFVKVNGKFSNGLYRRRQAERRLYANCA